MHKVLPRFPSILLTSAFALSASAASPALSAPPPATCDTHAQATNGLASDPEEGGQIARKSGGTTTGYDLKANAKTRVGGGSSDPEEGGEVTTAGNTAAKGKGRPHINDMQVTKQHDLSSTTLFKEAMPGGTSDCH